MEFGLSSDRSVFDCGSRWGSYPGKTRGIIQRELWFLPLQRKHEWGSPQLFVWHGRLVYLRLICGRGEFSEGAISAAGRLPFGFGGTDEGVRPYTRCSCESAVCCLDI